MVTKRNPTAKKALRRRIVASGLLAGQPTKAIARVANTSQRNVQRIAAEPETQFLVTEAFRPYQARLKKMAAKVVDVIDAALGALKTDGPDHTTGQTITAG